VSFRSATRAFGQKCFGRWHHKQVPLLKMTFRCHYENSKYVFALFDGKYESENEDSLSFRDTVTW